MESQVSLKRNGQINIILNEREKLSTSRETREENSYDPFVDIDHQFSSFIGLANLKDTMKEIYASITINQKREKAGLKAEKQVLHMLFKGNPGTGKTTVARQLARTLFEMNILSRGHFIEAERADLVGEYIGHTAQKTRDLIEKAKGGILFIDEAYSLGRGGDKDFGKEAIDTLVKHMEDSHNEFILILAGYPNEMEYFLSLNPGLVSRFPIVLEFEDYSVGQLLEIAKQMAAEREYHFTKEAEWKLQDYLIKQKQNKSHDFSNARFVRNLLEKSIRKHAVRLMRKQNLTTKDLTTITKSDLHLD
ncbi:stage V sporulation protein K [Sediminibacillus dalangtanensis]|uniref:Stage V sporulation protein K n=1 Tax=Sediminibacillus dalangtanensis TaxID=2729421 RepID=A0ABX7VYQ4_9BACI|nr:stage V sporulation protein K [Sediminibacillus dalangtanensis]QTM99492.1 stage V sporulation protein K [Sediminibacillus dalangtanensis]